MLACLASFTGLHKPDGLPLWPQYGGGDGTESLPGTADPRLIVDGGAFTEIATARAHLQLLRARGGQSCC